METIRNLRSQIDQGKTAVLAFKDGDEDIEVFIKFVQGLYVRTFSYIDRSNPFNQQRSEPHSSWEHLFEDLTDIEKSSDLWRIV